jgi:hypothetical protein
MLSYRFLIYCLNAHRRSFLRFPLPLVLILRMVILLRYIVLSFSVHGVDFFASKTIMLRCEQARNESMYGIDKELRE